MMSKLRGILLFVNLFAYLSAFTAGARDKKPEGYGFNVMHWGEKQGFPVSVQTMVQTPDGYLWIGNENGIYRFDGARVSYYDRHSVKALTEDDCSALFVTHDSILYCGLYNGLLVRCRGGIFEPVGTKKDFREKTILDLCDDANGNLFFATDGGGIVQFDGNHFSSISKQDGLLSDNTLTVCLGKDNEIWVGTDCGLSCIREGRITNFSKKEGLAITAVSALLSDPDGTLWIGGSEGQIMTLKGGKFSSVSNKINATGSSITSMAWSRDGTLWIGTAEEGIYLYTPASGSVSVVGMAQGLSSNMITVILQDSEGDLLAGTQGGGLNRMKKNLLKTITTTDGLKDNSIMSLFSNQEGDIWYGSLNGSVGVFRNGVFTDRTVQFGLSGLPVFSMGMSRDKAIWAAAPGSLVSFPENGTRRRYPAHDKLPNTLFHSVYAGKDGTIWAGTDAGIILIRGEQTSTLTLRDGLTDDKIFCFHEDDQGRMWIGTQEGGINIFQNGRLSSITRKEGLSDNLVLCFFQDKGGNMWVGTGHDGLNRIDGKSGAVSQLGQALGYPRTISYITEDLKGYLWMGSEEGILVAKKADLELFSKDRSHSVEVFRLGLPDGMITGSCTAGPFPTGCTTAEGNIWFATEQGIVVVNPALIERPDSGLHLFIQDILVNNESYGNRTVLDLSPGASHIEISYTSPSFTDPERLNFRYKLEQFDTGWIDVGSRRSAYYTELPPGKYTFRVELRDHYGQWSGQQATVLIHVKPYFYQTWWFILACLTVIVLFLYFLMKYRLRHIREMELEILVAERTNEIRKLNEELEQKVTDRTAQLAATNTELEAFSYSVSHDLRAPVRRIEGLIRALNEDYSDRLDQTARDFLSKISESVANMSQLIEELLKLSRIARQDLERTDVNISGMVRDIAAKLQNANPGHPVSFRTEDHIVLDGDPRLLQIAFQNLLDNCWKYTGKTEHPRVEVGMKMVDGKETLFVRDNGVGFDMSHYEKLFTPFQRLHSDDQFTGTGIGLATVKRIIVKHGGTIRAESEPGKGTTFIFTLK